MSLREAKNAPFILKKNLLVEKEDALNRSLREMEDANSIIVLLSALLPIVELLSLALDLLIVIHMHVQSVIVRILWKLREQLSVHNISAKWGVAHKVWIDRELINFVMLINVVMVVALIQPRMTETHIVDTTNVPLRVVQTLLIRLEEFAENTPAAKFLAANLLLSLERQPVRIINAKGVQIVPMCHLRRVAFVVDILVKLLGAKVLPVKDPFARITPNKGAVAKFRAVTLLQFKEGKFANNIKGDAKSQFVLWRPGNRMRWVLEE
mmetsp:Transcript_25907/g.35964  ORF Transcript_25907/g.35964 Transcript_25907/m.35964 type:complete len:266 (+) Transcript_25907:632-1429(+)